MRHKLFYASGLLALGISTLSARAAEAQTTAVGPYYATPSWDQTLPSATRFIVLSNFASNAVLDRETGLVWERAPGTADATIWIAASRHCATLSLGGRRGWRLPTLQELSSLLAPTQTSPMLPSGHPFIQSAAFSSYFSTTDNAIFSGSAPWALNFANGEINGQTGITSPPVDPTTSWCVRGGQGSDRQ